MRYPKITSGLLIASILLVSAACGSSEASQAAAQPADTIAESTLVPTTEPVETPAASADSSETEGAEDAVSASTSEVPVASTEAETTGTRAGVAVAQWADNVSIEVGDSSFRYVSNGLPSHELPDQFLIPLEGNMPPFDGDDISSEFEIRDTAGLIVASPLDVEITLDPVYSEEVTLTSLSTIGVTISGAPLFNDYEDQTRINIALDDNISLDGVFFIDACNGHPLASGASYHYHGVPYCVTDQVDVAGEHSTIIGVLLDGFPLYGSKDEGGVTVTNADLDECSGHFGPTPEFPDGIYHYHLTEDANPYSIDCFHGEIDYGSGGGQGGPPDGGGGGGDRPAGGPPGDDEGAAGGPPAEGQASADDEGGAGGPPAEGQASADGEAPAGGPPAGGGAAPGAGQPPDFAQAAATLGVAEQALLDALGGPPPDFDAAAVTLDISVERLQAALDAAS